MNSKLFGFTKDMVLTASGLDTTLRSQIQDPKNHLTTLAQESGGLVFDIGQLFSKKRTTLKKASTAMSKAVSKLSKPEQCQGMISHKKSLITIFGHKHFRPKF